MKRNLRHTSFKKYICLMTDRNRSEIIVKTTENPPNNIKQSQFHEDFDPSSPLRLMHVESFDNSDAFLARLNFLTKSTRSMKEKLIRSANPDWKDLVLSMDTMAQIPLNKQGLPGQSLLSA